MGAGRGEVRSRGPQVRMESGVSGSSETWEAAAVAVHLQDMDVVGEPVQQRAGEAFRSEHLGPLVERQVGGDQDGAALVALPEDLEEQFRSGGGQGDEAQCVDDQQAEAGQIPLQVEPPPLVPGFQRSTFMALLDHRICRMVTESGAPARKRNFNKPQKLFSLRNQSGQVCPTF